MKKDEAIEILHIALELTKETLDKKMHTASKKPGNAIIKTEDIYTDCVNIVHDNYKKLIGSE